MSSRPVRVRFAPSPTGPFHVGGARTALYNFLLARAEKGTFILRIDDTDRERSTTESLANILEGMRWLGLDWDEGPRTSDGPEAEGPASREYGHYFQSLKFERYREVVRDLHERGHAYPCFATPEEVDEGRQRMQEKIGVPMYDRRYRDLPKSEAAARIAAGEDHVWRFATPLETGKVLVQDRIKGDVEVDLQQIDDWVMLRKDGTPLYNLCSSVDDVDMAISDVVRGEEHFVNAVKQVLLFRALEVEPPRFAHLPLILGKDGKKLSKRKAQTNLLDYRDQGYPPEALVNFFTLLGWSFDGEREIFSLDEAIDAFSIDKLGKSGSIFDEEKMTWMCGMYIRATPIETLAERCTPFLVEQGVVDAAAIADSAPYVENVVACYRERFETYGELPPKVDLFFARAHERPEYEKKAEKMLRKKDGTAELLAAWKASLSDLALPPSWPDRPAAADAIRLPDHEDMSVPDGFEFSRPSAIEAAARALTEKLEIGFGQLLGPLRASLTGRAAGAGVFDIVYLLGRERCEARIDQAIEFLSQD